MEQDNKKITSEEYEKKINRRDIIIIILIILLIISIAFTIRSLTLFKEEYEKNNEKETSTSESLLYRNITNSDVTFSEGYTLTSAKIIIQANTDIEDFYAKISLLDSNGSVLENKIVTYSNMRSGSRYEVTFNISVNLLKVASYRVSDMSGKVRR